MAIAAFGPGILIVTRTDITVPVAINVGFVQEFSLDLAGTTKQLYGQKQYPLVAARATIKATGKFKSAEISGIAWNAFFFGQSGFTSGRKIWNIDSTFTLSTTVTTQQVGSSLSFDADLGIFYSTKGLPLQRVAAGAEVAGKYSVAGSSAPGTYTFAAADQGLGIKVTYTSSSTAGDGQTLAVTNQTIGTTPTFQVDYYTNLNQPTAKPFATRVYQCVSSKETLAFKLEDFMIPEFEFDFFANANDQVFDCYLPDVS